MSEYDSKALARGCAALVGERVFVAVVDPIKADGQRVGCTIDASSKGLSYAELEAIVGAIANEVASRLRLEACDCEPCGQRLDRLQRIWRVVGEGQTLPRSTH